MISETGILNQVSNGYIEGAGCFDIAAGGGATVTITPVPLFSPTFKFDSDCIGINESSHASTLHSGYGSRRRCFTDCRHLP